MSSVGDYMYPAEPDYEGTRDMLAALLSTSVDELTAPDRCLNRIVFANDDDRIRCLSHVDTTTHDTAAADNVQQKGTVLCNI